MGLRKERKQMSELSKDETKAYMESRGITENSYWQHKFKCTNCSLHFIVCSDYEYWPDEGTAREQKAREATGLIFCPECGSTGTKVQWKAEVEGFIFQAVPGDAKNMRFV